MFTDCGVTKRSGKYFQEGFWLARGKTLLERKLVRSCHQELDRRTQNGETFQGWKHLFKKLGHTPALLINNHD